MSYDWQSIVAIGLVMLAASHLGYRAWSVFIRKKSGGCGSQVCGSCDAAAPKSQLVLIEELPGLKSSTSRSKDVH